jgi:hypothetical protein
MGNEQRKEKRKEKKLLEHKERVAEFKRAQRYLGLRPTTPGGECSIFLPIWPVSSLCQMPVFPFHYI